MEKEYKIIIKDDGSFKLNCDDIKLDSTLKDILSFSLQYAHSFFTPNDLNLSNTSIDKVRSITESLDISEEDIATLKKVCMKIGLELNSKLMMYDSGLPKNWDDIIG